MKKTQISVIIATYHSDLEKVLFTLKSVLCQKDIEIEIIITDDGSHPSEEFIKCIETLFKSQNFFEYQILIHEENKGTVGNIFSAVQKASGEYIYAISPGDMIYSASTLSTWLRYAENNKIDICFGIPKYYHIEGGLPVIEPVLVPEIPDAYNAEDLEFVIRDFIFGDRINGVSYLRRRSLMEKYLEQINGKIKYVEDSSTSLLMMSDGIKIRFYPAPVCWYENGTGISTDGTSKGIQRMTADFEQIQTLVLEKHPEYSGFFIHNSQENKYIRLVQNPGFTIKRKKEKKKAAEKYRSIIEDSSGFPQYAQEEICKL